MPRYTSPAVAAIAVTLVVAACQGQAPIVEPTATDTPAQTGSKPRLERDRRSGVELIYQTQAVAAVALPGRVVVLESDFEHMHGVEPGSGEVVWRRRVQRDPEGAHTLHVDAFRVLLHAGQTLVIIDARDGRILGRSDDAPPPEELEVMIDDGVCTYAGPCGLQPFDCLTAERRGVYLPARDVVERDGVQACPAPPRPLGRAGADILVRRGPSGPGTEVVAYDVRGQPHWSISVAMADTLDGGVVENLDAAWIWDPASVAVLRASTGQVRWRVPTGFVAEDALVHEDALVVHGRDGGRPVIAAWDLPSGREKWRRRLRRRRVPLLPDDGPGPRSADRARVYEIVDLTTGDSVGRMAAGRDESLWRDADGGFVRTNGDFEELSDRGQIRRQRPYTGGEVLAIGATHIVSKAGADLLFHDRIALRERARLKGGFAVDPTSAQLGPHRVLLRRTEPRGVTMLLLGLEPRSAPSR